MLSLHILNVGSYHILWHSVGATKNDLSYPGSCARAANALEKQSREFFNKFFNKSSMAVRLSQPHWGIHSKIREEAESKSPQTLIPAF